MCETLLWLENSRKASQPSRMTGDLRQAQLWRGGVARDSGFLRLLVSEEGWGLGLGLPWHVECESRESCGLCDAPSTLPHHRRCPGYRFPEFGPWHHSPSASSCPPAPPCPPLSFLPVSLSSPHCGLSVSHSDSCHLFLRYLPPHCSPLLQLGSCNTITRLPLRILSMHCCSPSPSHSSLPRLQTWPSSHRLK